jgi:hypothetical protein
MKQQRTHAVSGQKIHAGKRTTGVVAALTAVKKNSRSMQAVTGNGTRETRYVLPLGNGWVVKDGNATNFTVITDSKREAIAIARSMARNEQALLVVHDKNGAVELQENYAS